MQLEGCNIIYLTACECSEGNYLLTSREQLERSQKLEMNDFKSSKVKEKHSGGTGLCMKIDLKGNEILTAEEFS